MYVLQVNVGLLVFYLLYRGLLARDTFLGMRRLYWWAAWVLAFLYPLVELGVWGRTETPLQVVMADYAEAMTVVVSAVAPEEAATWSWQDGLALLWAAGASALLLRMLVQLAVVCRLARRGRKVEWHGVRVLAVEGDNVPFSFFRWIFVQPGNHSEGELEEILAHEQAHVCQWHSLDVVVSELLCCLFWFNPAVWLAKRCVRQNLEFLADRAVVHSGFDRKNYQYHLLRLSYGVNIGQIVNNFNVSPLKKRIMMMNKKKSRHAGALKYALLLPVAGLLVLSANAEAVAETAENVVAHWTADEGPVRMTGVVVDENGKPLPGVTVVIKGSMLGVATDAEGRFEIVSPEDKTLVFTYVGRKTQEVAFDAGTTDIKVVMPVEDVELEPFVTTAYKEEPLEEMPSGVVMPQFLAGNVQDYIARHVQYPEESEKNKVEGKVYVQFVIDTTGKVVEPKVIRSVSPELDAEALRVVSEMPAWKPGKLNGKLAGVSFILPVNFALPGSAKVDDADVESILSQAADAAEEEGAVVEQGEVYKVVEDMPQFPGGNAFRYLAQHIRYPEEAVKNGIEGIVYVQFVVDKDGKIVEPKVVQGVCPELDAEALRVVSGMPAWKPGMQRGKPVAVSFVLPVVFHLVSK